MTALARTTDTTAHGAAPAGADRNQYLTFLLDGQGFAIEILAIREIIEYQGLTVVPTMPQLVRGVINLRGVALPVVDLLVRFGKKPIQPGKRACIVVVELGQGGQRVVGALVDAVSRVLEIGEDEIEPPPAFGAKIPTEFIRGVGKVDGKFVILLNVESVLALEGGPKAGRASTSEELAP